jgi:hypothetical protein
MKTFYHCRRARISCEPSCRFSLEEAQLIELALKYFLCLEKDRLVPELARHSPAAYERCYAGILSLEKMSEEFRAILADNPNP